MKVRVQMEGLDAVVASIGRLGKAGENAGKRALKAFTDRVVPKAKAGTPVEPEDGGELRESVRSTRPTRTASGRLSAGVIAGGAPLARAAGEAGKPLPGLYAVIQHEDFTLQHSTGGPKFVETPFMQEVVKVPNELQAEMDKEAAREGV